MMVRGKLKSRYVCQSCGAESLKWVGRCPQCQAWDSYVEEVVSAPGGTTAARRTDGTSAVQVLGDLQVHSQLRQPTGITELDRVLGGGIIAGSLVLIGGDPGIGKSTLLLQAADRLSRQAGGVLYVSGEESAQQIRLRAERLATHPSPLLLLCETDLEFILRQIEEHTPTVVVIDSIQTIYLPHLESTPGSVGQVRESAARLMDLAKRKGITVFLIGHVTKEGTIAGPRVLEHMVDTVLYFEGDRYHSYRILRAVKNRFGSTNEIGIFEMRQEGLVGVLNPSELFLAERSLGSPGSVVVCSMEGTRPLLLELQALATSANYGMPQRVANGLDNRRLAMLLAVLEKRVGLQLGTQDVFVNVAGGVRIDEPAVDLGAALAIASSFRDQPLDADAVVFGEIGLGGEVRRVGQIENRIREVKKLGFSKCVLSSKNVRDLADKQDLQIIGVDTLAQALDILLE